MRDKKYLYNPKSSEPFRISRSKIQLFLDCPRCFYLDRRVGVDFPEGYPFTLNSAVDTLLKKEFDIHRAKGTAHPLMKEYGIKAVPMKHDLIDSWREARSGGVVYLHPKTNFKVTGGIDDVWINSKKELIVVDYKATSKKAEVTLDADWQEGYKRQVEIYQWLFYKNGFKVSNTAYFVYCNGITDKKAFDANLEFRIKVLPYKGDFSWVESTLLKMKKCLDSDKIPASSENCDTCRYAEEYRKVIFK